MSSFGPQPLILPDFASSFSQVPCLQKEEGGRKGGRNLGEGDDAPLVIQGPWEAISAVAVVRE